MGSDSESKFCWFHYPSDINHLIDNFAVDTAANSTPAPSESASQSAPSISTPVSVTGIGNLNTHVPVHVQERTCNPDCIVRNLQLTYLCRVASGRRWWRPWVSHLTRVRLKSGLYISFSKFLDTMYTSLLTIDHSSSGRRRRRRLSWRPICSHKLILHYLHRKIPLLLRLQTI